MALLEADVNFQVVKAFVDRVRDRAIDQAVLKSLTPASRSSRSSATSCWRSSATPRAAWSTPAQRPRVILMLGLQGSGKTTTTGKLARLLSKQGRHPLVVSTDVRRPAAIQQLTVVGGKGRRARARPGRQLDPVARAAGAMAEARNTGSDVVIVDTAGRLHIDDELMQELAAIKQAVEPPDLLYVADAMTGQDAIKSAGEFNRQIGVTGVVLTKIDGDARGGAALSVVSVVGVPIAFVGAGERLEDLEPFHADRFVSRLLGMGDVLSLIEKAEEAIDEGRPRTSSRRSGRTPSPSSDFRDQLRTLRKMGPLEHIMRLLPGMGQLKELARAQARRAAAAADRGDHQLDDARRARSRRDHRRQPAQAHRAGQRHVGRRRQPPAQAVRRDAADAEDGGADDGRSHRRRRRRRRRKGPFSLMK